MLSSGLVHISDDSVGFRLVQFFFGRDIEVTAALLCFQLVC